MKHEKEKKKNLVLRLAWRVEEAAKATGLSVPFLRKEIRTGHLNAHKVGRCIVILDEELRNYLRRNN